MSEHEPERGPPDGEDPHDDRNPAERGGADDIDDLNDCYEWEFVP